MDSDFNDMIKGKAVLGHTTGSIFRNNYFNDKIIKFLEYKCANGHTYKEVAYREDDFRNRVHLSIGKAHFVNEIVEVYRYTENSLYRGANSLRQNLLGVRALLDMYDYFGGKNIEWIDLALDRLCEVNLEIVKSYNNINDMIELNQAFSKISKLIGFEKVLRKILHKDDEKVKKFTLKYRLLYKIYKYLDKKITKKLERIY